MFKAPNKNKGFVKSWSFEISKSQYNQWNFNGFGMLDRCHGVVMLEAPYKNNGFVNLRFIQYLNKLIKPQKCQSFWNVRSIGGWGWKRERSGSAPTGNPSPAPSTRTARIARTTRQINGARRFWWLGRKLAYFPAHQGCHGFTSWVPSESMVFFFFSF